MKRSLTASRAVAVGAALIASAAVIATAAAAARASAVACPPPMAKLLDALTEIDGQFGSGINFRQFDALLRRAQVAYLREPVRHQSGGCTHLVGVSAERALNSYIVGHNIWSKCVANYDTCTLDQIHARLQVRWKTASDNIAQAVNNFD